MALRFVSAIDRIVGWNLLSGLGSVAVESFKLLLGTGGLHDLGLHHFIEFLIGFGSGASGHRGGALDTHAFIHNLHEFVVGVHSVDGVAVVLGPVLGGAFVVTAYSVLSDELVVVACVEVLHAFLLEEAVAIFLAVEVS